jgi:hypothetical protein
MLPKGSGHERDEAPRIGKYLFVSAPFSIAIAPHHDDTLWVSTGHPMFNEAGALSTEVAPNELRSVQPFRACAFHHA